MFSHASKVYDSSNSISPMKTSQRFRSYKSKSVLVEKKKPKQHSPLKDNQRQKRDSYLLKVTKQTVVDTNYQPKSQIKDFLYPRAIVPKAKFQRIIGDVRKQYQKAPLKQHSDHRCRKSLQLNENSQLILNQKDLHKWRKQDHHLNYSKSRSSIDNYSLIDKDQQQRSTYFSLRKKQSKDIIKSFGQLSLQNIEEVVALSPAKKSSKPQMLSIGSGHQYLKHVLKRQKSPQFYEIQKSKESIIRKSMKEPKGQKRFFLYRNKVQSRYDRADPNWHLTLDYDSSLKEQLNHRQFEKQSNRFNIDQYHKYALRQNMSLIHKKTLE